MHIILKKYVEQLSDSFEIKEKEDKLFEIFCNYCVVSKSFLGRFNPINVTTSEDDASLDGIAIIIDNELILTADDATEIFSTHKTNFETKIIITQVKSGEKFEKEEIANFNLGIVDFFSLDPKLPNGEINKESLEIFNVILNNLKKVKNKLPDVEIYYCTSGNYDETKELKASFEIIQRSLIETELFFNVKVEPLDRKELGKIWNSINQNNEAKLKVIEYFGMPPMPNIKQSYVTLVNAKEFVDKVLIDEATGLIKHEVFEENIRAFLGNTPVNTKISKTLQDIENKDLFSVLNNGITIITPELTLTPNSKEIDLVNYQIINGCQTSNTLYENYNFLDDKINVVVKCVETSDENNITNIISATNSQTNISDEAFFSLKEKTKFVQKYFEIENSKNSIENHIYFERRENEFKIKDYQQSRIFDIKLLCRSYNAMFLNQPYNSARYVSKIFEIQSDNLFKDNDQESLYFASALCLYKLNNLINSKKFNANKYSYLKWHILSIYKHIANGKLEDIKPNSTKATKYATNIIDTLISDKKNYEKIFQECFKIIEILEIPSRDVIKRSKYSNDLNIEIEKYLAKKL
ncbi:AIPR family protein [Flavobacterium sp. GP15]|uniref:AIPR family protein n=1 Tax=Flavobacterium sp. GP15 TaxID=2758567 RepID=UPI00165DB12E|nr:AIPR family protein [Flavobacterium sp. GP15]